MEELFDNSFVQKLQNLSFRTQMSLDSGFQGARKSKSKGSSVEFSDFRQYLDGDDFRRIDWNAYGRFDKLFVKLFMEEREANIYILLDNSASMDFGEINKSFVSRRLAAAFSYMSLANYDSVTIACSKVSSSQNIKSLRGVNSFVQVMNFLKKVEYDKEADFLNVIKQIRPFKKGITVIISDLFLKEKLRDVVSYLKYLSHEVYVIHTLSKEDMNPQISGNVRLIDSETQNYFDIAVNSSVTKAYEHTYNSFIEGIKEVCAKYAVNYIDANTTLQFDEILKKVVT